jgi:uncharacterized protein (DUF2147 family)
MPIERTILRSVALAAALLATPALAGTDPQGVWMNDTGRGAIEIKPCGSKMCGHVVWVKDTSDTKGCGRQIIGALVSEGGGVWGGDDAWIYSPEKKKNYNVEVTPLKDGTLQVMGYAGMKFLSKTMIWTKAPDNLVRCNSEQTAAAPAPESTPSDSGKQAAAPETSPSEKSAPEASAPADEKDVAENEKGGVDLNGLGDKFGDVFQMKDGKCKLDTPWVKLDFDCKKKEEEPGQK